MKKLTKEDILQGINQRIIVKLEEYNNKEVIVRPLSNLEVSKILSKLQTPDASDNNEEKGEINLNLNANIDIYQNFEAMRLLAKEGLVEPKLDDQEISSLKLKSIEKISAAILDASGLAFSDDDLKKNSKK